MVFILSHLLADFAVNDLVIFLNRPRTKTMRTLISRILIGPPITQIFYRIFSPSWTLICLPNVRKCSLWSNCMEYKRKYGVDDNKIKFLLEVFKNKNQVTGYALPIPAWLEFQGVYTKEYKRIQKQRLSECRNVIAS